MIIAVRVWALASCASYRPRSGNCWELAGDREMAVKLGRQMLLGGAALGEVLGDVD